MLKIKQPIRAICLRWLRLRLAMVVGTRRAASSNTILIAGDDEGVTELHLNTLVGSLHVATAQYRR